MNLSSWPQCRLLFTVISGLIADSLIGCSGMVKNDRRREAWALDASVVQNEDLFWFVMNKFSSVFGSDVMSAQAVTLYNDPGARCPMNVLDPASIRLAMPSGMNFWSQFVYQLSHELTHYAIRQRNQAGGIGVRWFEETICEAMALWGLRVVCDDWRRSPYFDRPIYQFQMRKYLEDELRDNASGDLTPFHDVSSIDELVELDRLAEGEPGDPLGAMHQRDRRARERVALYDLLMRRRSDIKVLLDYTRHIQPVPSGARDPLFIDFVEWQRNDVAHQDFIRELGGIMELPGLTVDSSEV